MKNIEKIAVKLVRAYFLGDQDKLHTVICLVFAPRQILTEEEETGLLAWIKKEVAPKEAFIACNREYIERGNFKAFLNLERFSKNKAYKRLVQELKVED